MTERDLSMHYVCTSEEAWKLTKNQKEFWVSNCGCREGKGGCKRSRMDLCLMFTQEDAGSGSEKKKVDMEFVRGIFLEAKEKRLVSRPFRNRERTKVDGICFCCDDCCGYFLDPDEVCDKGETIALTDMKDCNDCGACAPVCHFGAREMQEDRLHVLKDNCSGCGLCVDACTTGCIKMILR